MVCKPASSEALCVHYLYLIRHYRSLAMYDARASLFMRFPFGKEGQVPKALVGDPYIKFHESNMPVSMPIAKPMPQLLSTGHESFRR